MPSEHQRTTADKLSHYGAGDIALACLCFADGLAGLT
jgi:hypothetical protein